MVFQNFQSPGIFTKLWKSKCTPRLKFFAWLLFVDRLNTRNMLLHRHYNVQPNSYYVLCSADNEEDLERLFFTCSFSLACWNKLGFHWDLTLPIGERVFNMMVSTGLNFFIEVFVFAVWEIWNLRNSKIFYNGTPSVRLWLKKCNTLEEKHNNPLENYHTAAQEHKRERGSNINHSDRLTEFHWSKISNSQTEICERIWNNDRIFTSKYFIRKHWFNTKLISVCTRAATPIMLTQNRAKHTRIR